MLLVAESVKVVCQNVRLGSLNVRSLRTLRAFNFTQSIVTLCPASTQNLTCQL